MKILWPVVAWPIFIFAALILTFWVYVLGSEIGKLLESFILGIPGFIYNFPANAYSTAFWLGSFCMSLARNPLRTICVALGMLLVITYFRAVAGHFDNPDHTFRGSTVRTIEDVFPDIEGASFSDSDVTNGRARGSAIQDHSTLFDTPSESIWSRTWGRLTAMFTRPSGGDGLL